MATQTDFDNLIVRIDAATDTLEDTVVALEGGVAQVDAKVAVATAQAVQATQAAVAATHARDDAEEALQTLQSTVGYGDAPATGVTYGRKDNAWVVVESGGGGGVGTVVSVNNKTPDAAGNIELSYSDLKNKPTLFSGAYNDLSGKPTLFSGAYADLTGKPTVLPEAPLDGKQYARKDGAWSEVEGGTGGGGTGGGGTNSAYTNLNPLAVKYSPTAVAWFKSNSRVGANVEFESEALANAALGSYTTDASTPATLSPYEAIDVRCFSHGNTFGLDLEEVYDPYIGDTVTRANCLVNTLVHPLYNGRLIASIPAGIYAVRWEGSDLSYLIGTDTLSTEFGISDDNIGRDFIVKVSEIGKMREVYLTFYSNPGFNKNPTQHVYRWNEWYALWGAV